MEDVHRLEGSSPQKGGLVIKKKEDKKDIFKKPQISKFGLDILATKLKKERETGLLCSFKDHDDNDEVFKDNETEDDVLKKSEKINKNYRSSNSRPETPSHSSPAITKSVREHFHERISEKHKGLYTSSKDKRKDDKRHKGSHKSSSREKDYYERKRSRHDSSRSSHRSDKSDRYRDPETPRYYEGNSRSSVGKSSWDEDDNTFKSKKKRSSWDFPTPMRYKSRSDDSVRSSRSDKSHKKFEDDTPRPTPAHRYNKWAADRKKTGATPRTGNETDSKPWQNDEDRNLWEDEQVRLDREWYNIDEGYDDENNPFAGASEDYVHKKEEQLELRKKKRISAQQRQANKDNELWEKNRMLTSGVVTKINFNEDFEEETIDRVNLLVHHAIPPFLDGRIVFTKVMGKIIEQSVIIIIIVIINLFRARYSCKRPYFRYGDGGS